MTEVDCDKFRLRFIVRLTPDKQCLLRVARTAGFNFGAQTHGYLAHVILLEHRRDFTYLLPSATETSELYPASLSHGETVSRGYVYMIS